MYKILIVLLILNIHLALGQVVINVEHRIGMPTQFKAKSYYPYYNQNGIRNEMQTKYDWGTIVTADFPIWKRMKLFLVTGLEWSETKTYLPIRDERYKEVLDNIEIDHQRLGLHVGIAKDFSLIKDKLCVRFGLSFVKRWHYKGSQTFTNDWFEYAQKVPVGYYYTINTYYDKLVYDLEHKINNSGYIYLNTNFYTSFKYHLTNGWRLGLSFSYSRNNFFYFDYFNDYYYSYPSPQITGDAASYTGGKYAVRNHFLYTGITVGYEFKKKEKLEPTF